MAMQPATGSSGTQDTTAQNGVRVLSQIALAQSQIAQALQNGIPQTIGTSPTATGGSATLPANPVNFLVLTLADGTVVKVPAYAE